MANIFNAAQYLELYPALADYGYNEANAWDHFVQYGAAELRTPNDELEGKVYAESVLNYANGNPELAEYFGVVVPAESLTAAQQADLLLHYVQYGNAEERENKIIDAPEQSEDADLGELKEALEAVVAADADVKEAVEAAVEGLEPDDLSEDATLEEQKTAVEGEYTAAAKIIQDGGDDAETETAKALAIPGFEDVEDAAVRTQLIEAKQAQLNSALQKEATALGKNKAKVDAQLTAAARVEDLGEEKEEAVVDAVAEGMKAVGLLPADSEVTYLGVEPADPDTDPENAYEITVGGETVTLSLNDKNNPVFGAAADAEADPEVVAQVKALANYDALVQSLQQNAVLESRLENANTVLTNANAALAEVNEDGSLDDEIEAYTTAKENVETFAENVAEFREVEAYQNAIDEAKTAKEAAEEALEELGYEINDTNSGTPENDLFVYTNEGATVFAFGLEGEDLFFFGDFAFVELKPNDDFEKGGFGDRNVLEIFAQQQGTDVVLYVEVNEVGGNATGFEDVDTITLVGVNLEDLSFDSGAGFLVA